MGWRHVVWTLPMLYPCPDGIPGKAFSREVGMELMARSIPLSPHLVTMDAAGHASTGTGGTPPRSNDSFTRISVARPRRRLLARLIVRLSAVRVAAVLITPLAVHALFSSVDISIKSEVHKVRWYGGWRAQ